MIQFVAWAIAYFRLVIRAGLVWGIDLRGSHAEVTESLGKHPVLFAEFNRVNEMKERMKGKLNGN